MSIIHMETEQVEALASKLMRSATNFYEKGDAFRHSAQRLQSNWSGGRSDRITGQMRSVSNQIHSLANQIDDLANLTHREVRQWIEVDANRQSFLSRYLGGIEYTWFDGVKNMIAIGGWGYVISKFHPIIGRSNSVSIYGKNWFLEKVLHWNPYKRIVKPETIQKELLGSSAIWKGGLIAGAIEGGQKAWDTYLNGEYAGTSHAVPAALVDGAVMGVLAGVATAGLIAISGAIAGPPIAVAAVTIGICVVGGIVVDKFIVDPLFNVWQGSELHDQVIEGRLLEESIFDDKIIEGTKRAGNWVKHAVQNRVQRDTDYIKNAFDGFIKPVVLQPV